MNTLFADSCPLSLRDVSSRDALEVVKVLGSGTLSQVLYATHKASGLPLAVKVYTKSKLSELSRRQIVRELEIHLPLSHPSILRLHSAFESGDQLCLVLEYAEGGDLFHELRRKGGRMTERAAVNRVLHPVMSALAYLHDMGVMHRDLKPENLLVDKEGRVKLCDFGLSINLNEERPVTRLGTLDYMSPEIVRCPKKRLPDENKDVESLAYSKPADVWAVGVLAYEILTGRPPFEGRSREETITRVLAGRLSIPPGISSGARSFIELALRPDPAARPTMRQLMGHIWILANRDGLGHSVHSGGLQPSNSNPNPIQPGPQVPLPPGSRLRAAASNRALGSGRSSSSLHPHPSRTDTSGAASAASSSSGGRGSPSVYDNARSDMMSSGDCSRASPEDDLKPTAALAAASDVGPSVPGWARSRLDSSERAPPGPSVQGSRGDRAAAPRGRAGLGSSVSFKAPERADRAEHAFSYRGHPHLSQSGASSGSLQLGLGPATPAASGSTAAALPAIYGAARTPQGGSEAGSGASRSGSGSQSSALSPRRTGASPQRGPPPPASSNPQPDRAYARGGLVESDSGRSSVSSVLRKMSGAASGPGYSSFAGYGTPVGRSRFGGAGGAVPMGQARALGAAAGGGGPGAAPYTARVASAYGTQG